MSDSRRDLRLADTLCHLTDLIHAVGKTRDRLLRGQLGNHNAIPRYVTILLSYSEAASCSSASFFTETASRNGSIGSALHRVGRADVQHGHHKIGTL